MLHAVCPLPQVRSISCPPKPRRALANRIVTEQPPFSAQIRLLQSLIKQYSEFISFPIKLWVTTSNPEQASKGKNTVVWLLHWPGVWVAPSPQVQVALHAGERGAPGIAVFISGCGLQSRFEGQLASKGEGHCWFCCCSSHGLQGFCHARISWGAALKGLRAQRVVQGGSAVQAAPPTPQRAEYQSQHLSLSCNLPQPSSPLLCVCVSSQVVDEEATAKAQEEADKKAAEEGKEAEKVAPGKCAAWLAFVWGLCTTTPAGLAAASWAALQTALLCALR